MNSHNENDQITRKAGGGIAWSFLAYGIGKGVMLLTTSILARLLTKNDFGLVAIAVVAVNYLSLVKDLGLGMALIQRKGDINETANTVFTVNLILGFGVSALVVPLAPFFAAYFNDPEVIPVLRWLGASFAINALGAIHVVWLMRDLDYRRKFIPDMGNSLVKGIISIWLAFIGFGVWSLVVGQLVGTLTSVILAWIVFPWRPRLTIDRDILGNLLKFGLPISGGDILTTIIDNMDYVIIGKVFGLAQLSIYTLAYRLPEMLLIGNLWVMGGVVFPTFSTIQDQPIELRRGFLAAVRVVQLFAVPVCLGLFIAATPIVRVIFGDQWLDAIPILRVLTLYAWIYSIGYHVGDVYKAIGRPDISFKLTIFTLIIIIPSLYIGSRFGLIGIAWGHLTAVLIRRIVSLNLATRFLDLTVLDILGEFKSALQSGLVMVIGTFPVLYITKDLSSFVQLIFIVLIGVVSYFGGLWWFERDNLIRMARRLGVLYR